jgi:hypothetical protein
MAVGIGRKLFFGLAATGRSLGDSGIGPERGEAFADSSVVSGLVAVMAPGGVGGSVRVPAATSPKSLGEARHALVPGQSSVRVAHRLHL